MESKKYTSQEMREAADNFWVGGVICEVRDGQGRVVKQIKDDVVIAMLRQAADTEEENVKLKEQNEWYERQPELMGETAREALLLLKAQEAEIAELHRRLNTATEALKDVVNSDGIQELLNGINSAKSALNTIAEEGEKGGE